MLVILRVKDCIKKPIKMHELGPVMKHLCSLIQIYKIEKRE